MMPSSVPMTAPLIDSPVQGPTASVAAHRLQGLPGLVDAHQAEAPRRRGRPPRLSRAAIFSCALRLIDAEGAGALTMRRLGAEMGVEAMSLYRHVSSKAALLDGVAAQLMAEHEVGSDDLDWAVTAYRFSLRIREIAQAHPAAFELVGLRALNTVDAMRPVEALLAALRAGGFPPDRAVAAFRLLSGHARGFALSEAAGFTLAKPSRASQGDGERLTGDKLPADEFPAIHELAGELARKSTEEDFRAGIDTIITGLRAELAATVESRESGGQARPRG
jgi:AcrR family transcriptional regulator